MGGDHPTFKGDAEAVEDLGGPPHGLPIAGAAHDQADEGGRGGGAHDICGRESSHDTVRHVGAPRRAAPPVAPQRPREDDRLPHPARPHSLPSWLDPAVLVLLALLLVGAHTAVHGLAISMDSLSYLEAARHLVSGHGLVTGDFELTGPERQPLTLWPPLYPLLLAPLQWLAGLIGEPLERVAIPLNAVLLGISMLLTSHLVADHHGRWPALAAAVALALLPATQVVYSYAWSETLFMPLVLAAYLCLARYLADPGRGARRWLPTAALLLGLACGVRYAGLGFLPALLLAVVLFPMLPVARRMRHALLALALALAPLLPVLLRNLALTGTLSGGERGLPEFRLASDVAHLGRLLYADVFGLPTPLSVLLLLTLTWLLTRLVLRRSAANPPSPESADGLWLPVLWTASYLGFLLLSRNLQEVDLDSRMLSVVMPYLLLIGLALHRRAAVSAGRIAASLPLLVWLAGTLVVGHATHTNLMTSLRDRGVPGTVNGIYYPSVSARELASLAELSAHVRLAPGDVVLTDLQRPALLGHWLRATIKGLPPSPDDAQLARLGELLRRPGLVVLTGPAAATPLRGCLTAGHPTFRFQAGSSGAIPLTLIPLPLPDPGCSGRAAIAAG